MTDLWGKIAALFGSKAGQGVLAIGLGACIGVAAAGYRQLPAQVRATDERVTRVDERITRVENTMTQLQRDLSDLRQSNAVQLCLAIAEKQRSDWRSCLTHGNGAQP